MPHSYSLLTRTIQLQGLLLLANPRLWALRARLLLMNSLAILPNYSPFVLVYTALYSDDLKRSICAFSTYTYTYTEHFMLKFYSCFYYTFSHIHTNQPIHGYTKIYPCFAYTRPVLPHTYTKNTTVRNCRTNHPTYCNPCNMDSTRYLIHLTQVWVISLNKNCSRMWNSYSHFVWA